MECALWQWVNGCTDIHNSFSLLIEIFVGSGIALFLFNIERKRKLKRTNVFMNTLVETLMPFQLDVKDLRKDIFEAGGADNYDQYITDTKWKEFNQRWTKIQNYKEQIDIRISGSSDNINENDLIDLQNLSLLLKEPLTIGIMDSLNQQMNVTSLLDSILLRSGTLLNKHKLKIEKYLKKTDDVIDEKIRKLSTTNASDSQIKVIKFWEQRKESNHKKASAILDMNFDS